MCEALLKPPAKCAEIKGGLVQKKTVVVSQDKGFFFYFKVFLFSILVGVIATVVFYIGYKLKLRKELKMRADVEVDNALSKYYQDTRRSETEEL